jgi:RND family efflux transporter MFP subunit
MDPGAFVRPGGTIVTVVDRRTVRICADVPEVDFDVVQPQAEVQIHVLATGQNLVGKIARRAPASDDSTRTLHFEMDVPNADRSMPVGTTALLRIEVGQPASATEIPLAAAAVRGEKASIFVADNGVARTRVVPVKGEIEGKLYLDPALAPGSLVITEGRELLDDGDKVSTLLAAGPSPLSEGPSPLEPGAHGG